MVVGLAVLALVDPIMVLLVDQIYLAKQTVPILQHWLIAQFLYSAEVAPAVAVPPPVVMAVAVPSPPAATAVSVDLVAVEELVVPPPTPPSPVPLAARGPGVAALPILILATLQRLVLAAMA
jgi:hypothetical protein